MQWWPVVTCMCGVAVSVGRRTFTCVSEEVGRWGRASRSVCV